MAVVPKEHAEAEQQCCQARDGYSAVEVAYTSGVAKHFILR
jgi:hypothetical protein